MMSTRSAACLLALFFLAACTSTTTTKRETLREMTARYATTENVNAATGEPAPPAEGPEDVPADHSMDPTRNPALLPTPLLRQSAAGSL